MHNINIAIITCLFFLHDLPLLGDFCLGLISSDSELDPLVAELVSLLFDEFSAILFCHEIERKLAKSIHRIKQPSSNILSKWHVGFKIRLGIIQMVNTRSSTVCAFPTKSSGLLDFAPDDRIIAE